MESPLPAATFDSAYENHAAPWVIGEPQTAIAELERGGGIRGAVLDAGCGTGEHTIHLTQLGYDVLGIDFSSRAVGLARANASEHGVAGRFEVADALRLAESLGEGRFDTVVDSALFHVFTPEDRAVYARSLHAVCRPDAVVHVLALSDRGPGFGPQISDTAIREAFTADTGWELEEIAPTTYRSIARTDDAAKLGLRPGDAVDLPAWLSRARRV